jgi:hypothetical protein
MAETVRDPAASARGGRGAAIRRRGKEIAGAVWVCYNPARVTSDNGVIDSMATETIPDPR